ncbi:DoxX family protein [Nocardioides sp. QY071]|uniref:DoxX family protein n=1 Tax=Nocardioides sp. QY071 TaxID=3044187 RepID=UPI00249C6090|nr:DoxX family protein [Nocardioides sp. QY071]WGY01853.1 DoxX family protein [Nocardioides sp. QY071]
MNRLLRPLPATGQHLALLVARVLVGVVLVAHGWQKLDEYTLDGTAASFEVMGVPGARAAATFAAFAELGGGALLIIGLLTPVAALLVALNMAGAWYYGHRGTGIFVAEGGGELVMVIGAVVLAIAATGAGRFSLDAILQRRATAR